MISLYLNSVAKVKEFFFVSNHIGENIKYFDSSKNEYNFYYENNIIKDSMQA
jgi:hypothetical protein